MSPSRLVSAVGFVATLLLAGAAEAQTANGSPTDPAPPGLIGTPRPISRTAPSVGVPRGNPALPIARVPAPRPTAAERAEQRKLEHDLRICIGC